MSMPEVDPSKVVAVFEQLLGPRLGRWTATLLLAAASLFGLVWCFEAIWKHGGKELFDALRGVSLPGLPSFTGNDAPALASVFLFILIVYGAIVVAILYFLGRRLFKRSVSQSAVDRLAELRNEGIDTVYAKPVMDASELTAWLATKKAWEEKVRNHVRDHFPKSDYLYASHLGAVKEYFSIGALNQEHLKELYFVIRQLEIVEELLNSYRH